MGEHPSIPYPCAFSVPCSLFDVPSIPSISHPILSIRSNSHPHPDGLAGARPSMRFTLPNHRSFPSSFKIRHSSICGSTPPILSILLEHSTANKELPTVIFPCAFGVPCSLFDVLYLALRTPQSTIPPHALCPMRHAFCSHVPLSTFHVLHSIPQSTINLQQSLPRSGLSKKQRPPRELFRISETTCQSCPEPGSSDSRF